MPLGPRLPESMGLCGGRGLQQCLLLSGLGLLWQFDISILSTSTWPDTMLTARPLLMGLLLRGASSLRLEMSMPVIPSSCSWPPRGCKLGMSARLRLMLIQIPRASVHSRCGAHVAMGMRMRQPRRVRGLTHYRPPFVLIFMLPTPQRHRPHSDWPCMPCRCGPAGPGFRGCPVFQHRQESRCGGDSRRRSWLMVRGTSGPEPQKAGGVYVAAAVSEVRLGWQGHGDSAVPVCSPSSPILPLVPGGMH